ncbi:hypothetical protein A6U86_11385 [Rhizobium sp. AC27/96]|nr:hypothetical protein A6U86_11385 [Rhizobium sp. AC27/96]
MIIGKPSRLLYAHIKVISPDVQEIGKVDIVLIIQTACLREYPLRCRVTVKIKRLVAYSIGFCLKFKLV